MASAQLTDKEIVSELKRLGYTPGPGTESTRPVYLKKLKKLWEEQPQPRGSRSGKGRSSSGNINSNGGSGASNSNAAARAPGLSARPPDGDVTRLSASRSEKRRPGKFVLGFSSDESDAEAPQKKGGPNHGGSRRDRGSALQTPNFRPAGTPAASLGLSVDRKSISASPWWADRGKSNDLEETERDSRTLNGNKAFYESNSSKLVRDYSDSDEEEEEEGERERPRERRLTSRHPSSPYRSVWSAEKSAHDSPDFSLDMLGERDEKKPREFSGSYVSRSYQKLSGIDGDDNSSGTGGGGIAPGSFNKNHIDNGDGESPCSSSSSRFSIGLRPRFPSYTATYRANHSNHTGFNHSYSHASALKPKQHTALGNTIQPCIIIICLVLSNAVCQITFLSFSVVLHPFGPEFDLQYDINDRDLILNLLLSLHEHLANIAGEHDCGDLKNPLNRSVSFSDASTYLKLQNEAYENLIETSLEWVMKTKDVVGIRLIGADSAQPIEDVSEISRLESIHPRMSFFCRLRRAFFTVIHRVLFVLAGIGVVLGLVYCMKYRWRKEEEETRQMYDMVERIIDVMRSHNEACQENKDLQQYLPIPHVRDSLVQPQDRKKMKKVWDRAVAFLSANESRIRTEKQRIGGADFMVWRWLQPSVSPDKMSSMPSKVWQGQAFPLDRRNSPPNSLTPCLKIRNMFDPVMEVGENWHLAIQEAILEKCSDNDGIVHIAVDKNSREGCVYVKCLSAEHSGKAFKALHGSWFDGKLVTVKYLRLDRYHQRFPQALGCNMPLKPSSSCMNSMSRLNQRSSTSSSLGFS
ncbi:inner nuclear membrane protein Man1-like [Sinocyclocheilus grahami]|uniref:inner nuclear membrane protein Man1-like n=1 Tax=Sinocyclocheilus grahami TaxID=75366 RepID=UPI0007ACF2CB|nr:PREDICTED: inner nuclear membrane protein Man1-like [Sinocyclocheilus grahami]